MASYPGAKVHRINRRKLGRGQYPTGNMVTAVLTNPSADVVQIAFSRPVVVSGTIPLTTSNGVFVSQAVISPTVVQQTFSLTQAAATVSMPSNPANVAANPAGGIVGATVTF
jgi:hypothetical protein